MKGKDHQRKGESFVRRLINVNELLFDGITLILLAVLAERLIPGGTIRLTGESGVILLAVVLLMDLFIPWYLADLFASYRDIYGHPVGKTGGYAAQPENPETVPGGAASGSFPARLRRWGHNILFTFSMLIPLVVFSVLGILLPVIMINYITFYRPLAGAVPEPVQIGILLTAGTAFLIAGWYVGYAGLQSGPQTKTVLGMSRRSLLLLLGVFGIPGLIAMIPSLYKNPPEYALAILGLVLGIIGLIIAVINLLRFLLARRLFREYLAPAIIALLLSCFYLIQGVLAQARGSEIHFLATPAGFLIYCILPVRLFLLFAPPVRLINFLICLGSLALLIRSMALEIKLPKIWWMIFFK